MRTILGRVVDGRIEAPDADLREGEVVGILVQDADGVVLTQEEEDELSAAMAEVEAGQWIDGDTVLRELRELREQGNLGSDHGRRH
jgi:hypothetical protein